MKFIITSGFKYVDIDVLACAIACKELLAKREIDAEVVLTAPFNETITRTIRNWDISIGTKQPENPEEYHYIAVDVSEPEYIEKFVVFERITDIFDHHFGKKEYWEPILGKRCRIEYTGSCATLIWEEFKKAKKDKDIGPLSANLLYTAIMANTLNLRGRVTQPRDRIAFSQLKKYTTLPPDWSGQYYSEIEQQITADIPGAVRADTKVFRLHNKKYCIGQLELWDASSLISQPDLLNIARESLEVSDSDEKYWVLSIPSISENRNYFVTSHTLIQKELENISGAVFSKNSIGITKALWLRKEIIRALMEKQT